MDLLVSFRERKEVKNAEFDGSPIGVLGITDLSPDSPRVRGTRCDGLYSNNGT